MWFGIGILELVGMGIALVTTLLLVALHRRWWKWSLVVLLCCTAAACFTPADPVSTLLVGALLLISFVTGVFCAGSLRPLAT